MHGNKNIFIVCVMICSLLFSVAAVSGDSDSKELRNCIRNLFFLPESSLLIGSCGTEPFASIKLWSADDGSLIDKIIIDRDKDRRYAYIDQMDISSSGDLLAAIVGNEIRMFSIKDKEWLWKTKWFKGDTYFPHTIRFTSDDRQVIVPGVKALEVFDVVSGEVNEKQAEPLREYKYLEVGPRGNTLSPSGRYMVVWQELSDWTEHRHWWQKLILNKWVTVWDIKENKMVDRFKKPAGVLYSAAFTLDEKYILFSEIDGGHIYVWSIEDKKTVKEWKVNWNYRASVDIDWMTFSPDGKYLALYGLFSIRVWDYDKEEVVFDLEDVAYNPPPLRYPYPLKFSPDGKYLVLEKNGHLCLYETGTWKEKWCVRSWPEDNCCPK